MGNQIKAKNEDFQIFDLLARYVRCWPWFMLSVILCCGSAFLYVKMTPKTYLRSASVMIKEDSNTSDVAAAFTKYNMFQPKSNVNDEVEAFKSPHLIQEVIYRLNLTTNYAIKDGLKEVELYSQSPIIAIFPDKLKTESFSFHVELKPDSMVILSDFKQKKETFDKSIKVKLNETVQTPVGSVMISPSPFYSSNIYHIPVKVTKNSVRDVTEKFIEQLSVSLSSKLNNIIVLDFRDVSTERADDLLNTLIEVYNENWMTEKNKVALITKKFIDERLPLIEQDLGGIDDNVEQYKSKNLLTNIKSAASLYMQESSTYAGKILEVSNQISIAEYIKEYLDDTNREVDLLPNNTGLNNSAVESQVGQYNTLLLKRNELIANSSERNPVIIDMDNSLNAMRQSIIQAINNLIATLNLQLSGLQAQEARMTKNIASNPGQEKHLSSIEREQKTKEALYLHLLQKREENELSLAMTTTNTRIISPPSGSKTPVKPKKYMILLVALMMGVGMPGGVIWGRDMLNTTIRGKEDLDNLSAPLLGTIPIAGGKGKKTGGLLLQEKGRDVINESFRIIRTNIDLMRSKKSNVVLFTSLEPGSGKTFTALNLAMSFAFAGKKTILLDLDLRMATLSSFLSSPDQGISSYLNKQYFTIQKNYFYPGFDIIPVGTIPPNPTELLMSDYLGMLVDKLKETYDYIFLDCTPVNIVADATIVAKLADTCVFIIREGVTDRRGLHELENIYHGGNFNNMTLVLNGSKQKVSYGKYNTYYNGTANDMVMLPKSGYSALAGKSGYLTEGAKS